LIKGTIWEGKIIINCIKKPIPREWHEELFRVAKEEGYLFFFSFDKTVVDFETLNVP
jgi:pseudaminic acid synthase